MDQYYSLSNGVVIPSIGYGCGTIKGLAKLGKRRLLFMWAKEKYYNITVSKYRENNKYPLKNDLKKDRFIPGVLKETMADENGIRLFDTARAYVNSENILGKGIKESGLPRKELFIITKLTNRDQANGTVLQGFEMSLRELGLDYVDAYLMHWPQLGTYLNSWKYMEEIYKSGKARAIGVCNCHIHHLEAINKIAEIKPHINELECHLLLQQNQVLEYCREKDIQVIAHTPTGRALMKLGESEIIQKLCKKHSKTISQIIMRWHLQRKVIPIPNTTDYTHLRENFDIFDFVLSEEDMRLLSMLDSGIRIWPDPDQCDFTKL